MQNGLFSYTNLQFLLETNFPMFFFSWETSPMQKVKLKIYVVTVYLKHEWSDGQYSGNERNICNGHNV